MTGHRTGWDGHRTDSGSHSLNLLPPECPTDSHVNFSLYKKNLGILDILNNER